MDYVREHIRKYWGIKYRHTLGIAFASFAIAMAIGISFTLLTSRLATTDYLGYLVFWGLLIAMTAVIFIMNFSAAHTGSVEYMNESEHRQHSKRMGLWLLSIVLGVVAFALPLVFISSFVEPLMLLFSLGCLVWILYFSTFLLFRHSFGELAIGAAAFWIMFSFGLYVMGNAAFGAASLALFSIYLSSMTMVIVSGVVGLALIINSSRDSFAEFSKTIEHLKERRRLPRPRRKRQAKG